MNQKKLFSIEINDTVHNLYVHKKLYNHYQTQPPHIQKAIQDTLTVKILKSMRTNLQVGHRDSFSK